ncbi:MAG: DUF2071 domain-containing protein [Caldilineales bacterium]|nr:DUF2071 domain-containing protein [Caldilineales bacterium]
MDAAVILAQNEHRPWPLLKQPWVMAQTWESLLFIHWPVPVDVLRPVIPPRLQIDTFDGEAWLGVVPFFMRRTQPYRLPLPFGLGDLPELNVRTYVTDGEKAGVWFFSLDAGRTTAVYTARLWYHLPYFQARMTVVANPDGIDFLSQRTHPGAPSAAFAARYAPASAPYLARPGSLEHWLTERYCLYAADRRGNIYRGENHHAPWPLQSAAAEVTRNDMAQAAGIKLPDAVPLLHFARSIDVVFWELHRVDGQ